MGMTGPTASTGATGPTGFTGSTGSTGALVLSGIYMHSRTYEEVWTNYLFTFPSRYVYSFGSDLTLDSPFPSNIRINTTGRYLISFGCMARATSGGGAIGLKVNGYLFHGIEMQVLTSTSYVDYSLTTICQLNSGDSIAFVNTGAFTVYTWSGTYGVGQFACIARIG
jgi:hypothetical protein